MATPKKEVLKKKGQKGKYAEWIEPQGLALITGWSRNGLTNEQICKNIGVHPATLCDWQNKFPELSKALKNGREVSDLAVENALFTKAIRGDTTAIIFYLKNRKPKQWRDRPAEIELEESKLVLEHNKTRLEMMKTQLEITRLAKIVGVDMPSEISLDNLTDEEIEVLTRIVKKANLSEVNNENLLEAQTSIN